MEVLLKNIKYALRSDWEAYHLALDKTLESNNEIVREVFAITGFDNIFEFI